jgi:hypothetical protein
MLTSLQGRQPSRLMHCTRLSLHKYMPRSSRASDRSSLDIATYTYRNWARVMPKRSARRRSVSPFLTKYVGPSRSNALSGRLPMPLFVSFYSCLLNACLQIHPFRQIAVRLRRVAAGDTLTHSLRHVTYSHTEGRDADREQTPVRHGNLGIDAPKLDPIGSIPVCRHLLQRLLSLRNTHHTPLQLHPPRLPPYTDTRYGYRHGRRGEVWAFVVERDLGAETAAEHVVVEAAVMHALHLRRHMQGGDMHCVSASHVTHACALQLTLSHTLACLCSALASTHRVHVL